MTLTAKQEGFAQSVVSGMTQADAYRANYDADGMADKTIQEAASRLMADSKVSARVTELKEALAEQQLWTRKDSVEALKRVAAQESAPAALVSAVKELNAMHGYNEPSKTEVLHKGLTGIALVDADDCSEG